MDAALTLMHGWFYMGIDGTDLASEEGLRSAVIVSLFTDRRAGPDDVIPDGSGDPRGSWMDGVLPDTGDAMGSRLWLLEREKVLPAVVLRARDYVLEALEWLKQDGIVQDISVRAWASGMSCLNIAVQLRRGAEINRFEFLDIWNAEVSHAMAEADVTGAD